MKRTSMSHQSQTYFGRWDIGGGLVLHNRDEGFYLQPVGRFPVGLIFAYLLIVIAVPGYGMFSSVTLYAIIDVVRESGGLEGVFALVTGDTRFLLVAIGYVLFMVLFPVYALLFRAKRMVRFSTVDYTITFGTFWHYRLRFARLRIPFEKVREIEILTTYQELRGSSPSMGAAGRKVSYWLSVIVDEQPWYIIKLPRGEQMTDTMRVITNECKLLLVYESFPPSFSR